MAGVTRVEFIAELLDVIHANYAQYVKAEYVACRDCPPEGGGCGTCSSTGVVERYTIDWKKLLASEGARHVTGFTMSGGVLIPKFKDKDKAYSLLASALGLNKVQLENTVNAFGSNMTNDEITRRIAELQSITQTHNDGEH